VSQTSNAVANRSADTSTRQYLTFQLDGEEYGVGIQTVQEIRGWSSVTTLPESPEWVLGVMDLRGSVVPVIDLRRRLALTPTTFGPATVVIVIRVELAADNQIIGLVVDAVSEVCDVNENQLHEMPEIGSLASSEMVQSLAHIDGKTIILLDAERLVSGQQMH
jgi:purine-binding chemotaxis protein CheW